MPENPTVRFGSRRAANAFRDKAGPWLAADDDRRYTEIEFKPDTPEAVLIRATETAADSRERETGERPTRTALTSSERDRMDFSRDGVNVIKCRWLKGIAEFHGVDDWIAHSDFSATVSENREILQRAARRQAAVRESGESEEVELANRFAVAKKFRKCQIEAAKAAAREGDPDALAFLEEVAAFDGDEFDVDLRSLHADAAAD